MLLLHLSGRAGCIYSKEENYVVVSDKTVRVITLQMYKWWVTYF